MEVVAPVLSLILVVAGVFVVIDGILRIFVLAGRAVADRTDELEPIRVTFREDK